MMFIHEDAQMQLYRDFFEYAADCNKRYANHGRAQFDWHCRRWLTWLGLLSACPFGGFGA